MARIQSDRFQLAVGTSECWKCHKQAHVVAPIAPIGSTAIDDGDPEPLVVNEAAVLMEVERMSDKLGVAAQSAAPTFRPDFSNRTVRSWVGRRHRPTERCWTSSAARSCAGRCPTSNHQPFAASVARASCRPLAFKRIPPFSAVAPAFAEHSRCHLASLRATPHAARISRFRFSLAFASPLFGSCSSSVSLPLLFAHICKRRSRACTRLFVKSEAPITRRCPPWARGGAGPSCRPPARLEAGR